ncbi:MAG: DedA family protein [Chromatiales bacterium]|nr:DedA family protein [Chromatiales bacterium]
MIFRGLYKKTTAWAKRPQALKYLYGLSVAESVFFPVPPEALMIPICSMQTQRALYIAFWVTVCSVIGGLIGYGIGYFLFNQIEPLIKLSDYYPAYLQSVELFNEWGAWIILIAAFSPIPYKLFTISAGVLAQSLPIFIFASLVGRGGRFFLIALLLRYASPRLLPYMEDRIEIFGWATVAVLVLVIYISYVI